MRDIATSNGLANHVMPVGYPCNLLFSTLDPDGRPSQAYRTLFLQEMIGRVDQILVAEDLGLPDAQAQLEEVFSPLAIPTRYFVHDSRRGITASMDEMYRNVRTPYIFHLEDDWVCTAAQRDFIERSITILERKPKILQVWLRPPHDCNGHPLEGGLFHAGDAQYHLLRTGFEGVWHGYSNNPNVRRLREYTLLPGGYTSCETGDSGVTEAEIGKFYLEKGFVAAVLCCPDAGFVHIGVSRSVDGHLHKSQVNFHRLYTKELLAKQRQHYPRLGLLGKLLRY